MNQVRVPGKFAEACETPAFPEVWRAQVNFYHSPCQRRFAWWRRTSAEFFLDNDQLAEALGPWEDGHIHLSNRSALTVRRPPEQGSHAVFGIVIRIELTFGADGERFRAHLAGRDGVELVRTGPVRFLGVLDPDVDATFEFTCGHCGGRLRPVSLEELREQMGRSPDGKVWL